MYVSFRPTHTHYFISHKRRQQLGYDGWLGKMPGARWNIFSLIFLGAFNLFPRGFDF